MSKKEKELKALPHHLPISICYFQLFKGFPVTYLFQLDTAMKIKKKNRAIYTRKNKTRLT